MTLEVRNINQAKLGGFKRVLIEKVAPSIDGGRYAVKRVIGEEVKVLAVIIADGHDRVEASLRFRHVSQGAWQCIPMIYDDNDGYSASFIVSQVGEYEFKVEGRLAGANTGDPTTSGSYLVVVEPKLAEFGAWYEFFPRSCPGRAGVHGTFQDCARFLPLVAEMGFDVVYLPPIHPIGTSHRKGRNNSTEARACDPGSPWGIGSADGGHKSVHPQLGTLYDFRALVKAAESRSMKIAMDLAFQCSPDHPHVSEHPEWFRKRADGTIQYAENPPKKYQDIYPYDFECEAWPKLWEELKGTVLFWMEQGVRVFRVDNPHTKPFEFWRWLIKEVKRVDPSVIFLAEAFTRPHIMCHLAKAGFSQSYTYFTWRNTRAELIEYLNELRGPDLREYFRPNFWPTTPDILSGRLRGGERADFLIRFLLAATLSPSYGIYGPAFELCENRPRDDESEEFLDSEKYEIKDWNINRFDSLRLEIVAVNKIRRTNPAFHSNKFLRFHDVANEQMLCFSRYSVADSNLVFVVISLDASKRQAGQLEFDPASLELPMQHAFIAEDLLSGRVYRWQVGKNSVEVDPNLPAQIFRIETSVSTEGKVHE